MSRRGLNISCPYKKSAVTVNSEELIANTEYVTLMTRCRLNGYRYNRVRLTGMRLGQRRTAYTTTVP